MWGTEMTLKWLKDIVNKDKNRNFRVVSVKEDRVCKFCKSVIVSGTECLTTNTKGRGRNWVCGSCVEKISEYHDARLALNNVPFGDEGQYLVCQDWLKECEAECIAIGYEVGV